jgi:acetyltransferase-like isoleucine patch superfamily enzyme
MVQMQINLARHLRIVLAHYRKRAITRMLMHRLQYRHPTLITHPTAIWDYGYDDVEAIELGKGVFVGAYAEIVVHKHSRHTRTEGRLIAGDGAVISAGANIRAAGGVIAIGAGSGIGQHSVVVAVNHAIRPGVARFNTPYDESRTGVAIGENVWIGAQCVLLPGITIGDDAVVTAGSVVSTSVPAGELWGGVPARRRTSVAEFARFRR